MVVLDSSALIPLSWVSRLDLVDEAFSALRTTEGVREEVLVEGKPGTVPLRTFLEDVEIYETPADASGVAELSGSAETDAAVVLLAEDRGEPLLANDRGLIDVARTHGVDCWWVTTLLLERTAAGHLSADAATDILYDLVTEGMNLHPAVYARVEQALQERGE